MSKLKPRVPFKPGTTSSVIEQLQNRGGSGKTEL